MATQPQYELNFRDYWRILRKRKMFIFATTIIFLAVSMYRASKQIPVYQAVSKIKLEQRQTIAGALLESSFSLSVGDPLASTARIIESGPIAEKTAQHIGLIHEGVTPEEKRTAIDEIQGSISTVQIENTNLIDIKASNRDPQLAMKIANGTAEVFVEWDLNEKNKEARKVREFVEIQLANVDKKLHESEEKLKTFREMAGFQEISPLITLKTQLAEFLVKATEKHPEVIRLKQRITELEKQLKSIPGGETDYTRLVREVKLNEQLYSLFKQKFEEARIVEAEKVSDVSIVDYATLPTSPLGGGKRTILTLGGLMGLLVGFILAFFVENLDTSLSTIEGVESLLSAPVLAVIPRNQPEAGEVKKKRGLPRINFPFLEGIFGWQEEEIDHKARLIVHDQPKSSIAESYRSLRTNLKFSEGVTGKSLVVTSSGPQEGKSTVLINLGLTTAQMGSKTLVVDSDLRRPSIYKTFKVDREPGLYEVLTGGTPWQEVVRGIPDMLLGGMALDEVSKTPGLDHFFIMPAGRLPLNPSEILASREVDDLLLELRKNFDVILYDTPPILPVTDAALLAPKVDGVVIVYEIGRTARSALLRAKQQIESVGGKVIGIVLNHIKSESESTSGYPYYHYRYYGQEKKSKPQKGQPLGAQRSSTT